MQIKFFIAIVLLLPISLQNVAKAEALENPSNGPQGPTSIYQTFGVGISVSDVVFFYPYVQFFPLSGNLTAQSTLVGFNAIINLF
jgi:hypothetical protein